MAWSCTCLEVCQLCQTCRRRQSKSCLVVFCIALVPSVGNHKFASWNSVCKVRCIVCSPTKPRIDPHNLWLEDCYLETQLVFTSSFSANRKVSAFCTQFEKRQHFVRNLKSVSAFANRQLFLSILSAICQHFVSNSSAISAIRTK